MIVINSRFLTQNITGVQRYAIEICKNLPTKIKNQNIIFIAPKGNINKVDGLENIVLKQFGNFKGNLWEQIDLVNYLKKNGSPLLINFSGIGPVFYKNKIIYLHDLAFKHYPKSFSYLFQKTYNTFIPISIRNAKKTITVSEYVKTDIIKNYHIKNIEVVYASHSKKFKNQNLEREKIILSVCSTDPRKNLIKLIKAFNLIKTDWRLILVGSKNNSFSKVNFKDEVSLDNVSFTGYITDDELVDYYNRASLFVYPSIFEGFGIPPLEAQACGCPSLISNASCLPEIYKDSVEYCNPKSIKSISTKISKLINNNKKREQLREKGFENIENYSWKKSANKLNKIIRANIFP